MATTKDRALLRHLGTLFNVGAIRELTDGQLLERFARGDGEAAELAFAALVERHGAMVLRVCRSQSLDPHDAHDAFQATFLVLIEKANGLWVRDSMGPWLHRVALRTASCARSAAIRRRRLERRAAELAPIQHDDDPEALERSRLLHEEIERLPERYRVPIVLCDLEGRTCEEAARVLGHPAGTIKSWRARGRERLRRQLIRAGLAPSMAVELAMVPDAARAAVLRATADQAARAAARILSDRIAAGTVPATVSLLVNGVIRTMFYRQLRMAFAAVCAVGVVGGGFATVGLVAADDPKGGQIAAPAAIPDSSPPRPPQIFANSKVLKGQAWPMTLRDAVRCALDNSEVVRVVAVGEAAPGSTGPPPISIRRRNDGATHARLQSEMMAAVRSVEQTYWYLSQAYVQFWAAERAVNLAQDILRREQADLMAGRGTDADVAESAQRLDQFKLGLVTRTSDVTTAESQLRHILGLPEGDKRWIIPTTPPTEAKLEPEWDRSLAAMLEKQPDIQDAREMVKLAEEKAASPELNRAAEAFGPAAPIGPALPATARTAPLVERQKAFLQQVIHQTTHTLARFFLEIDANYKQLKIASGLRAAAAQRLDAQRAYYEEGRIMIDRYLDAVSQYATAVATEAQYLANYNISIVALEEAKGTLLEYEKIVVVEPPKGILPPAALADARVKPAAIPPKSSAPYFLGLLIGDGTLKPAAIPPKSSAPVTPPAASPAIGPGPTATQALPPGARKPTPAGTTYSFDFTIGRGPRPIQIRGSFTVSPARERLE